MESILRDKQLKHAIEIDNHLFLIILQKGRFILNKKEKSADDLDVIKKVKSQHNAEELGKT